jgi:lambda family phage portal protein
LIGEIVDGVVGLFSPASAAKRAHARNVYRSISGGYEAGKQSRSNDRWRPGNNSADLEMQGTVDMTRARARALVRDNAYARGILAAIVRNVIGRGIRPQARVANGETPNEEFNRAAEDLFRRWAPRCDVTGRLHFFELQRAVIREMKEAGEVLIQFVTSNDRSRPVPFALEMIDADRLAVDKLFPRGVNNETGNEVRRGVEINSSGQPVAYWIHRSHPNDVNITRQQIDRIDASKILHLFRQERVGQTRGVSAFAPVIWWLKNLGFYVENEMQASAVASCFSVAIKTIDGPLSGNLADACDSEGSDDSGNKFEYLQPGMVSRLLPGEDIQVINPARNSSNSAEWINLMLRSMAVGTGLSFERLSRDYSKTNFSSNRAGDLEDRREFRADQDFLIWHLCEPVWQRLISAGVEAGLDGFPEAADFLANYDAWTRHVWLPPGWEWVDPRNESTAAATDLASNVATLTDLLGERGIDLREHLAKRRDEVALLEEYGLIAVGKEPPPEPEVTDVSN